MGNKKKHLTYEERFFIEKMLKSGASLVSIAETLSRGPSTISQEVKENGGLKKYTAAKAHNRSQVKQSYKKQRLTKAMTNIELRAYIDKSNKEGMSPETISRSLKSISHIPYASSKSIRKYLKLKI